MPARLATACAALAALAFASPAQASKTQLSVFEDDALLVLSSSSVRERTLDDLVELGADTIHSIVFWNKVSPQPLDRKRPAGFDGSDPANYPAELWDRYDGLVRGAAVRGIDLMLSPASPMPYWASRCRGSAKVLRTCKPDMTQFKRFVQALGRRYSGDYADENQGRGLLPRVNHWSVWNEPNLGSWLSPQWERKGGKLRPVAPGLYRSLVRAAIKGLRASGHSSDEILFGETAPLGRKSGAPSTRPIAPGDFIRWTLCMDNRGRSLRGALAKSLRCTGSFAKLPVTGAAHHPYTRGGSRPPTARGGASEITIASISRLKSILRQGGRKGRIRRGLPIFYTEFGFQTNPPDDIFGVSEDKQAEWLNQSDWIAWRDPSVRSVAQYELRDEASQAAFQTGLRFIDGRPKRGYVAYRLPIWVSRNGSRLRVWGHLRPAEDDQRERVEIQNGASADGPWETVAELPVTNRKGYFITNVAKRSGVWRLRWTPSTGGPAITSRVARVARR